MYLAHLDSEKLQRAEQATAFLVSLSQFWEPAHRALLLTLHGQLKQELADRKPAWNPGKEVTR